MWGKAPLKVGKIATILHCLHAAHLGWEISPKITIETIRSAIKFIKFTTDQALSLNLEICESNELAPNWAKIVFLASRKGTVTVSEIRQGFNSKHRPSAHQVRDWFKQLSTMKYGKVVEVALPSMLVKIKSSGWKSVDRRLSNSCCNRGVKGTVRSLFGLAAFRLPFF
jgi:hypothetical protein